MKRTLSTAICATLLATAPAVAAPPQSALVGAAAAPAPFALAQKLGGTMHKGKRCTFSKKEAIIVGVAWFLGGIPGAILTPIACKRDLL